MENIPYMLTGDSLATAYDPVTPVPVIAVEDIGAAAAAAFQDRENSTVLISSLLAIS